MAVCPICRAQTTPTLLPVQARREGRVLLSLEVPVRRCEACGHVDVEDGVQDELIALLERRTRPGDEIVFPLED
jgi:YgiT-type zinc finger domain-containing protein